MAERRKRNSSKVNLTISVFFHTALVVILIVFAAREGILGKKLKELTVTIVPKEKPPEPPKPEKPPEPPKIEEPKVEPPKMAAAPPPKVETAPPPTAPEPSGVPAPAAPPPAALPAFDFSDGAKAVQTISDPSELYKAFVEHSLLSRWGRPEDMADDNFVADVEMSVDSSGKVLGYRWLSGSGNQKWDASVKGALAQLKVLSRPPPKGFPSRFNVRFDVESLKSENAIPLSLQ